MLKRGNINAFEEIVSRGKLFFSKAGESLEKANKMKSWPAYEKEAEKADDFLAKALEEFNKAIEIDPNIAELYLLRKKSRVGMDDFTGDLSTAISLDPCCAEAFYLYGRSLLSADPVADVQAIEYFSKAIELDPAYSDAYCWRGKALICAGRNEDALADLSKAVEIDHDHLEALSARGILFEESGRLDLAVLDFSKKIEITLETIEVWKSYMNRGNVYAELGDFENALADYDKALESDPDDMGIIFLNKGLLYAKENCLDQAIECYTQSIDVSCTCDPFIYYLRAHAYARRMEYDRSWEDVHKVIFLKGDIDPEFLEYLKKASGRTK